MELWESPSTFGVFSRQFMRIQNVTLRMAPDDLRNAKHTVLGATPGVDTGIAGNPHISRVGHRGVQVYKTSKVKVYPAE